MASLVTLLDDAIIHRRAFGGVVVTFKSASSSTLLRITPTKLSPATMADTKKTVLITGSTRGIGLALAEHYAKADWNIIGSARASSNTDQVLRPRKHVIIVHCANRVLLWWSEAARGTFALEDCVA
jgi:hypothetical protein